MSRLTRRLLLGASALPLLAHAVPGLAQAFLASGSGTSGGGSTVTTFNLVNPTSTQSNAWIDHGLQFADGDVPSGQIPQLYIGGSLVTTQAIDQEVAWSASGAMRRCNFTFQVPSLPTGNTLVTVKTAVASQDHTAMTVATFLTWATANTWNRTWEVTIDGTLWATDAVTCLNTANVGNWKQSPTVTEFITWGPLKNAGTSHFIQARFEVRVYSAGGVISNVRCVCLLENGDVKSVGTNKNGDYPIEIYNLKDGSNTSLWNRSAVSPAATLTISATGSGAPYTGVYDFRQNQTYTAGSAVLSANNAGWFVESSGSIGTINSCTTTVATGYIPCRKDAICLSQSGNTTSLTLNGQLVTSGTSYPMTWGNKRVNITADADFSGKTFTINGTATDGSTSEALTGPAASATVWSTKKWLSVTSVTLAAGTVGNVMVGVGGFPSLSLTSGQWRLLPDVFANHTRLVQITWHTNQPRYTINYNRSYLVNSKFTHNYPFSDFGSLASLVAADITSLNAYPVGTSTLYPDSRDYNPYCYGYGNFGYTTDEGTTGDRSELGVLTYWDLLWLSEGSATAQQTITDHARVLSQRWSIFFRDENTGKPVNPADRPSFASNSGDNLAVMPTPGGFGGAGFSWVNLEGSHAANLSVRTGYFITGDFWQFETLIFDAVAEGYWTSSVSLGSGASRYIVGDAQTRGLAWCPSRVGQALEAYPDTLHSSNLTLAKSAISTWLSNFETVLNTGFVTTGPDPFDSIPISGGTSRGDYHWTISNSSNNRTCPPWEMEYIVGAWGQLYDNDVLSADGVSFFTWLAAYPLNFATKSTEMNTRYGYGYYVPTGPAIGQSYNGLAAWYTACQSTLAASDPVIQNFTMLYPNWFNNDQINCSLTLGATSGSGVSVTALNPLFQSFHVGCRLEMVSGVGKGTIASVIDSTHATINITNTFASTAISDNNNSLIYMLGLPAVGANTEGTFKHHLAYNLGSNDFPHLWFGGLGASASIAGNYSACVTAQSSMKTWFSNDGNSIASMIGNLQRFSYRQMMAAR